LEYGFDNYETLKGSSGSPAKAAAMDQQVGFRGDRMSAIIPAREKSQLKVSEGFILQLGSFRDKQRAQSLSHQINAKGIDAFVEKAATNRRESAYRVRVGPYSELIAAQETAQEILSKSGHRALILPFQSGREAGDQAKAPTGEIN
jgi:cell division protein FtsN